MTNFMATIFTAGGAWNVRKGRLHFVGLQWRQIGEKEQSF
jgi:hypothetical protein